MNGAHEITGLNRRCLLSVIWDPYFSPSAESR